MKNSFRTFITVVFAGLLLAACADQIQPTTGTPPTLKPPTSSQPTRTPLATFTPFPPFLTATLAPLPKDVFDNFPELSGYCLVKTTFGVVQSGDTIEEHVVLDSMIGQVWFSLSWRGGNLDLSLIQPDGTHIDSSTPQTINMSSTSDSSKEEYFIRAPQSGTWTARILGDSNAPTGNAYMLEVSALDATVTSISFDKDEYFTGNLIKLSASIEDSVSASPLGPEYIYGVIMKVIVEDPALQQYSLELYDDGLHGDGEANDGVYGNAFDNTLVNGIYKFYFQLSGLNNRAGEPFTRECFLAKTVKPIPPPTSSAGPGADTKACNGSIEISEPVVVRAQDVAGNDGSEFSRYAFYPKAVSTGAGILVTWQMGFDGQFPQPNAYMRLLDGDANPIGDVNLLFERNWVGQSYGLIGTDRGAILTYCGRYNADDRITSAFLDPYGGLISEQPRAPTCADWGPDVISIGSHLLTAWTESSVWPEPVSYKLILDFMDVDGSSLYTKQALLEGNRLSPLAVGHERLLVAVNTGRALILHRFDLEGNELTERVILNPVTHEVNGQIVVGTFNTPYVIPTFEGWMLLAASEVSGFYVAHLAPDGSLISDPVIVDIDTRFVNGFDDVIAYRDGAVIVDEMVLFLSADGTIAQTWYPPPDEKQSWGDLFEHQGRLFLVYTSEPKSRNPLTNQVLLRELQCVP